ncbi:hypothetical protein VP01_2278g2 [Puccinia sorghi]|uniref:Uncharacterized protein n=1 Tax=Puccinia sorghi TaxID=27349 RepID=A0A0L6V831_9BASI|nr:hypothetical protein VP01_2278g2 [Puccinia sorghi]
MFKPRSPSQLKLRIQSNCSCNGYWPKNYMEIRKELYNDIKAQSNFYLTQGFFHKLEHTATQIRVEKNRPCGSNHWMSMPSISNLPVELYNRPVFYSSSSWSQSFFTPSNTL